MPIVASTHTLIDWTSQLPCLTLLLVFLFIDTFIHGSVDLLIVAAKSFERTFFNIPAQLHSSMSGSSSTGRHRVTRACNNCRFRKVKCTGAIPCAQCNHLNLPCIFSSSNKPRGPPARNGLLTKLRNNDTEVNAATGPLQNPRHVPSTDGEAFYRGLKHVDFLMSSQEYTTDFFMSLIPEYERVAYPVNPIITGTEIVESIRYMHTDYTHAALVYAYAAVTVNLSQGIWPEAGQVSARVHDLLKLSVSMRRRVEEARSLFEVPMSVTRIVTCIFLEICMMAFKRYDQSFMLLREAMAMIQMFTIHCKASQDRVEMDLPETARMQRLYWELFIHERFLTLMSNYPSILPSPSSGTPVEDTTIPTHVDVGFRQLANLFSIVDEDFLAHWSANTDPNQPYIEMTTAWIEHKQQQLDDNERLTAPGASTIENRTMSSVFLTELQEADLFIMRTWLRTLVWQQAMSRYLLSSHPNSTSHDGMSLNFPVRRLSKQLRSLVVQLEDKASITMHGFGMLQKMFEITNAITDVIALVPTTTDTEAEIGEDARRATDLVFLVRLLFSFDRIDHAQREIIKLKMSNLKTRFPGLGYEEWEA